ncbi:amino-acid N-acetyltransferase [Sulfuriferula thiophila]|uniref:amino-acid N-acetyltransferase n=1 Tax=Sulfuriferula thiophila TaxID=1781211 RepID=UPI000F60C2CF|nr:amino-acid N-acetyltransferase [Sulfuriferula thiophila]
MPTMPLNSFVHWFRAATPYIHAFRGKTFVLAFGGEVLTDGQFTRLAHDLNLLNSLGVRLVLVHGVRPQVEAHLTERQAAIRYVDGLRVTDADALACVKEAVGEVRVEIEALLSMGLPNSPMANADIRVASGNFVTARPLGVRQGVDLQHTGAVRKINAAAIRQRLDDNDMVLLSPLGYSPTGEIFNLSLEDVATAAAQALAADKLIFLMETDGVQDAEGELLHILTVPEAQRILEQHADLADDVGYYLPCAIDACQQGVGRVHMISRHVDGALLTELFTHEGVGTMLTPARLETLRTATIDDVGGILQLIHPLEEEGMLVRRSRERLEMEIERFIVLEHDGLLIGCAALYPFVDERAGELACLAVHPDYRGNARGDVLLEAAEKAARQARLERLFVLTTHTAHWFVERGFDSANVSELPMQKQALYNYQRRSKVFVKTL